MLQTFKKCSNIEWISNDNSMNQFATLKLKNCFWDFIYQCKIFVKKCSFTVYPNNEWVFNDNSMKQLFKLRWLIQSTYLRYFLFDIQFDDSSVCYSFIYRMWRHAVGLARECYFCILFWCNDCHDRILFNQYIMVSRTNCNAMDCRCSILQKLDSSRHFIPLYSPGLYWDCVYSCLY